MERRAPAEPGGVTEVSQAVTEVGSKQGGLFHMPINEAVKFLKEDEAMEKHFRDQGFGPEHPEVRQYRRRRMSQLFVLQTQVMHSAMQIEMASKVVEHAATGTRTVLQTQT